MAKNKSVLGVMVDVMTRKEIYDEYKNIDELLIMKRRELDDLNTELLAKRREKFQLINDLEKLSQNNNVSTPEEIAELIDKNIMDNAYKQPKQTMSNIDAVLNSLGIEDTDTVNRIKDSRNINSNIPLSESPALG